jgi:hypothetical protein
VKKPIAFFVTACLAVLWACSSAEQPAANEAIQQAVERYLTGRTDLDLASMQVVVDNVVYQGDTADAGVTIVSRKDPQAKMQMSYRLRKTDSGWQVEPKPPSEAGAHGGAASPGAGGEPQDLPPGHPSVGGSSGGESPDLPPGHPPVGGKTAPEGGREN